LNKKCNQLLEKARTNPVGLKFSELCKLCECIGMHLNRPAVPHSIYKRLNPTFIQSVQETSDGMAKAYQVRQLVYQIDEHGLA